ncbi:MAG: sulfite exporter TauE/SafE family protein [Methanobacterium paludis]|nr:sulfite exporter TauE/SafE family protein [Methanobacterium paludis]
MEFLVYIVILLITGTFVGFASGLLGVGGGFIMVPVQFFLLTAIGVDPTIAIRIAFGTSLAVILPTALSGTLGHMRRGAVLRRPAMFMGVAGIIGAFIGGITASNVPGDILRFLFGFLVLAAALWMVVARYPETGEEPKKRALSYIFWGFAAGFAAGLLGIGGGILMVPILIILMGFGAHKAVGTSSAVIIFTSIGGIVAYILGGMNATGLPPYSVGYINILQLVLLAGASIPMAQVGVKVSHKLPEKQLKYIYIALMFYIGLKMIGVL